MYRYLASRLAGMLAVLAIVAVIVFVLTRAASGDPISVLLGDQATAEDIATGVRLGLNHPMGPLTLADVIGLDTCLYIADVLHRELGEDKYRPAALLRQYVAAGWVGRKSGRGFYKYA